MVCCSQVPGMRVVVRRFCLVASSGIGLLFENCIVDASIFECHRRIHLNLYGLGFFDTFDFVLS